MADEPLLTPTPEGATVRYRGRLLYSSETPRSSAVRRALASDPLERTLYVVPSLGLGYGLDALLDRCPPSSHILCVEVDQTLMALGTRGQGNPLPRDERLTIVRTDDPAVVAGLFLRMGVARFRRCRLVNLCGGYLLFRERYDAMFHALEALVAEHWQNRMTSIHLGALWVKNCLENLALLGRASALESLRAPGPVVVIGAGPSLDRSILALRALRGRSRLVAVDTALPILAAHGIRPDVLVILEAQQANLYDFLPLPDPTMPVIADLTAHPASLRLFGGPLAFVLSSFAELSLFARMGEAGLAPRRIPPLGSVGVAACAVALELTDSDVLPCGLDFAYDRDKTHASGAPFHTLGLLRADRLHPPLSFFYGAIQGRPLIREPGQPLTDAILRSYAGSLRALAGASGGRIHKMAPDGTTTHWSPAAGGTGLPDRGDPRLAEPWAAPEPGAVERFYRREIAACDRALSCLAKLLGAASPGVATVEPSPEDAQALRSVDYAAAHFPESAGGEGVPERPTPSFLARLRHAVMVYRTRIGRLAARPVASGRPTAPPA